MLYYYFFFYITEISIEENGKKLGAIGKIEEGKIDDNSLLLILMSEEEFEFIIDNSFLLCSFCTGIVVVKERAKEYSN